MPTVAVAGSGSMFTSTVKLTLDEAAVPAKAWVTESQQDTPTQLSVKCLPSCTISQLLDVVQEGINTSMGGAFTGMETANEWNSQLAHLLSSCPYEEEMTKRVKKALEEGGTVTLERTLDKKNIVLKMVCQTPKGKTGQTATWSDDAPVLLTVEKALFEGQILDRDAQASSVLKDGDLFQVSGTAKRKGMPMVMCCTVQ